MGDLFCLRRCCRCAGLQPHEVLACRSVRPERAKTVDAQYDAPGLEGHLRAHEKRHQARGHVGRPGHRQEPQFGAGPLAPGDEAREGGAVFLFTKGQGGDWKAQRQQWEDWKPSGCPYLQKPKNWYLVDASEQTPTFKLAAKTVIACSPDPGHYSNFVKDGGCVFIEAFRWAEVEACYPQLKTQVDQEDLRQRFQQVGGALRTILASQTGYTRAVQLQRARQRTSRQWSVPLRVI